MASAIQVAETNFEKSSEKIGEWIDCKGKESREDIVIMLVQALWWYGLVERKDMEKITKKKYLIKLCK